MASLVHIDCEECGGKSIVKIPTKYQEEYEVQCCPLCGSPCETDQDLADEE